MAETTTISWCDRTWSPWYGCTQVSMGPQGACEGCYARHLSETRMGRVVFGAPGRGIGTRDARADTAWKDPIRWNRTSPGDFVFPSMCDPFDNHPALVELRRRFFDLIWATPKLTWLLLTKRPQNIRRLFAEAYAKTGHEMAFPDKYWPPNAAIGCTVVSQSEADRDIPHLLAAKAALKAPFAFVSMEPLLGPVDISPWLRDLCPHCVRADCVPSLRADSAEVFSLCGRFVMETPGPALDWVIAGGETDQGQHKARPSHPDWFRSLRDQCAATDVPFHFKQWGEWSPYAPSGCRSQPGPGAKSGDWPHMWRVGKKAAGNVLDGVLHDARPEVRA